MSSQPRIAGPLRQLKAWRTSRWLPIIQESPREPRLAPRTRLARTTWTPGSDLSNMRWNHALMEGCTLDAVNLAGAKLRFASITASRLNGATITDADLRDVTIIDTNMTGAHLDGIDASNARFAAVTLYGATLKGANLDGTTMECCQLANADLAGASLAGACIGGSMRIELHASQQIIPSRLTRADLSDTNLTGL